VVEVVVVVVVVVVDGVEGEVVDGVEGEVGVVVEVEVEVEVGGEVVVGDVVEDGGEVGVEDEVVGVGVVGVEVGVVVGVVITRRREKGCTTLLGVNAVGFLLERSWNATGARCASKMRAGFGTGLGPRRSPSYRRTGLVNQKSANFLRRFRRC
jgi:hypothetical protein